MLCAIGCALGCKNPPADVARKDAESANGVTRTDARLVSDDSDPQDPFLHASACELEPIRLPTELTRLEHDLDGTFEGKKLRATLSKIKSTSVSGDVARELVEVKEKMEVAALALGGARDDVAFSASECGQFEDALKELVGVFRGHDDSRADSLALVVRCWWNTTDGQRRLSMVDTEMSRLLGLRSTLHAASPNDQRVRAIDALRDKYALFRAALAKIQPADSNYASSWRDLAFTFDKIAARSGMKRADRKRLSAALVAMPQMEIAARQLDQVIEQIHRVKELTRYTGAWGMCRNLALSYSPGETEAHGEGDIATLKEQWQGRSAAVSALIERALEVPGTEL